MSNVMIQGIISRRTIRKFDGRDISEDVMEDLLKAGMAAPTAFDARPWHFVAIQNRAMMSSLAAAMPGCEMCAQTASAVLVCADASTEKLPGIWVQDCSACSQNIQLAAHAHSLGAVWLAIYLVEERVQAVRSLLSIPMAITPFALIAVGYPAESGAMVDRFLHDRIHRDRW